MVKELTKVQAFALRVLATRFLNHGIQFGHEELTSQIVSYVNDGPLKLGAAIKNSLIQNEHTAIEESDNGIHVTVRFQAFEFDFQFNNFGQLLITCAERLNILNDLTALVQQWQTEAAILENRSAESDMAMGMGQVYIKCASELLQLVEKCCGPKSV